MRQIRHETDIAAPADAVWAILVDMTNWHTWNAYTTFEALEVKAGATVTLRFSVDGDGKSQTASCTLHEVDADKLILRWGGGLGPLLQGNHWLRLERRGSNTCRLFHGEDFTGLLPALNVGLPYAKLDRNYLLMNEALQARAEGRDPARAK